MEDEKSGTQVGQNPSDCQSLFVALRRRQEEAADMVGCYANEMNEIETEELHVYSGKKPQCRGLLYDE